MALDGDKANGGEDRHPAPLRGWFVSQVRTSLTLSRQIPARFDVSAQAMFPKMDKLRLATQIRQDMWRAVQNTRGFSPVVRVTEHGDGLIVRAGGRLIGRAPHARLEAVIAEVLANPNNRARWGRFAGRER